MGVGDYVKVVDVRISSGAGRAGTFDEMSPHESTCIERRSCIESRHKTWRDWRRSGALGWRNQAPKSKHYFMKADEVVLGR